MTADQITVTESSNVFQRLGNSFKAVVFGILIFVIAFPLLWWNEGRAVRRYLTLKEGIGIVVTTDATRVDPALEGGLVHLTGMAETDEVLTDPVFGIAENAIHLERDVEMYQWEEDRRTETRKKLGGGEERVTTYSYDRSWSGTPIRSGNFEEPSGHQNPPMPYEGQSWSAEDVRVGAYRLSPGLIGAISGSEPVPLPGDVEAGLPADLQGQARLSGSTLYVGADPAAPAIGDLRIAFRRTPGGTVSLLARQEGDRLTRYETKRGSIQRLQMGEHSAQAMFEKAKQENTILTWAIRLAGFLMMTIGLKVIAEPLSVLGDIIPLLGRATRAITGFVAAIIAFALSFVTIGLAWIAYRPVLGVGLLAIAGGAIFYSRARARTAAPAPASAPPPPPPPPPGG